MKSEEQFDQFRRDIGEVLERYKDEFACEDGEMPLIEEWVIVVYAGDASQEHGAMNTLTNAKAKHRAQGLLQAGLMSMYRIAN